MNMSVHLGFMIGRNVLVHSRLYSRRRADISCPAGNLTAGGFALMLLVRKFDTELMAMVGFLQFGSRQYRAYWGSLVYRAYIPYTLCCLNRHVVVWPDYIFSGLLAWGAGLFAFWGEFGHQQSTFSVTPVKSKLSKLSLMSERPQIKSRVFFSWAYFERLKFSGGMICVLASHAVHHGTNCIVSTTLR